MGPLPTLGNFPIALEEMQGATSPISPLNGDSRSHQLFAVARGGSTSASDNGTETEIPDSSFPVLLFFG